MSALKFVFSAVILVLNTLLFCASMTPFALIKLLLPFAPVRRATDRVLNFIPQLWISVNNFWLMAVNRSQWQVSGLEGLRPDGWYLVTSNHLSWVDILVLQRVLNRRIPMLKFFLKYELIYVPVLGLAWWALDFPFMRRHSEEFLRKHPEMREKDRETTRKACEKFALIPTSVMNFLEGTRFTKAKHAKQQSPYRYLLKPKAGGIALALDALGAKFDSILDVTIVYPQGIPTFMDFMTGRVQRVIVRVRKIPVPQALVTGNYGEDPEFRKAFSEWVQQLWREKDAQIGQLLSESGPKLASPR